MAGRLQPRIPTLVNEVDLSDSILMAIDDASVTPGVETFGRTHDISQLGLRNRPIYLGSAVSSRCYSTIGVTTLLSELAISLRGAIFADRSSAVASNAASGRLKKKPCISAQSCFLK
jgi:hypothetical protein